MNNRFYIALLAFLLLFPGCFNNQQNTAKHTLFIQALLNLSVLTSIKKALTPIANKIIREELNLAEDNNFAFFLPKDRLYQQLTLYYANNVYENGDTLIFSALEGFQNNKHLPLQQAVLSPKVEFLVISKMNW